MINIIVTSLLIVLFFLFGHITQAFKRLYGLLTKIFLKIASFFGIKIVAKEHSVRVSDEFKKTYKGIKKVKLSKKNIKQKSSINWVCFGILIVSILLIFLNLGVISGNAVSNWICLIINKIGIKMTKVDTNVFYTAILFSVISFSLSGLLARWKETKQQRIENQQAKIKQKALALMDSKDLLDEAKKKDNDKYKEMRK